MMLCMTKTIDVSTPVLALTSAPSVPTRRNGLTPFVLSIVSVYALVLVLKHLSHIVMNVMLSYTYYGLPDTGRADVGVDVGVLLSFRFRGAARDSVRVTMLVVVRCVRTWLCGPIVTTSESNRTSGGMVNLKTPGLRSSSSVVLVMFFIVLTSMQATECSCRLCSLPWVFSMLLTLALTMLMAPSVPVRIGGTFSVSRVGHDISEDVLIVHFMNLVLTLVSRTSSTATSEKLVTIIVLIFCTHGYFDLGRTC